MEFPVYFFASKRWTSTPHAIEKVPWVCVTFGSFISPVPPDLRSPQVLTNALCANCLQRMRDEFLDQTEEPLHVRPFRVCIECLLVNPFRVNKEGQRAARRFVEMDSHAARLCARWLEDERQFVQQLPLFPGLRLKASENVKRQDAPFSPAGVLADIFEHFAAGHPG
jgi:hypothetical protein